MTGRGVITAAKMQLLADELIIAAIVVKNYELLRMENAADQDDLRRCGYGKI